MLLGGDKIVHLHIALLDGFLLEALFVGVISRLTILILALCLLLGFLLVGILVVNAVIKVLVVELFVVAVKFTDSGVETDHNIFVFHKALGHLQNFNGCLLTCLSVEGAEND